MGSPNKFGDSSLRENHSKKNWLDDAEVETSRNVVDFSQRQQQLLKDQDKDIETLGDVISRQKAMAYGIHSELDFHNEIIDDISVAMSKTDQEIVRNTRNIKMISRKHGTCGYWLIIFALFIAIILLSFGF